MPDFSARPQLMMSGRISKDTRSGGITVLSRILAVTLLAAVSIGSAAQGTVVTGVIRDTRDVPIVGATACQVNTSNCTAADLNGIFHLLLEPGRDMSLKIECLGFNPVEVAIDESTVYPLKINLTPIYIPDELFLDDRYSDLKNKVIMRSSLTMDAFFFDFEEFTPALGAHNTDLMKYFAVIGPELGASFSGVYFGLGIGMGYSYQNDLDTISVDLNNTMYRLSIGYDLVSSRRIRITPLLSARWLRYRLLNYPGDRKISLTRYLDERDLDLRFNQTIAVAGLNLEYLMYSGMQGQGDYWSFGIAGGYAVKLNQTPWIYSKGNRVMTDHSMGLNPLTFSLTVSWYNIAR
ncbi:MAG: hypothetical protein RB288_02940 [Bacteroidales bacterium]|nr:hypothetical protein [Bacteroidales bacterium]